MSPNCQSQNGQFVVTVSAGTFRRNVRAEYFITAPPDSQFYPMILAEELFHVGQYEGTTSSIFSDLWSAQNVIDEVVGMAPFQASSCEEARELAENAFLNALEAEELRCEVLLAARRCDMEREAKTAIGSTHVLSMPCIYPECP